MIYYALFGDFVIALIFVVFFSIIWQLVEGKLTLGVQPHADPNPSLGLQLSLF